MLLYNIVSTEQTLKLKEFLFELMLSGINYEQKMFESCCVEAIFNLCPFLVIGLRRKSIVTVAYFRAFFSNSDFRQSMQR